MKPYYEQDGITIYHGDAFDLLPELEADAIITDPPYGTGWVRGGESVGKFKAKNHEAGWDKFSTAWIGLARAKRHAIFTHDAGIPELARRLPAFRLRFYVKSNPRPAMRGLDAPSVEPIFIHPRVFYSKGPAHREAYNGDCKFHPTQKPVEIMAWLIRDMTLPNDVILDPFMGSGTTLWAAKQLGRRAIGIEAEEKYCTIAAERCAQGVLL